MRRKHIAFSFRALIALIVCLSLSAPLGAHAGGKGKKKQGLDGVDVNAAIDDCEHRVSGPADLIAKLQTPPIKGKTCVVVDVTLPRGDGGLTLTTTVGPIGSGELPCRSPYVHADVPGEVTIATGGLPFPFSADVIVQLPCVPTGWRGVVNSAMKAVGWRDQPTILIAGPELKQQHKCVGSAACKLGVIASFVESLAIRENAAVLQQMIALVWDDKSKKWSWKGALPARDATAVGPVATSALEDPASLKINFDVAHGRDVEGEDGTRAPHVGGYAKSRVNLDFDAAGFGFHLAGDLFLGEFCTPAKMTGKLKLALDPEGVQATVDAAANANPAPANPSKLRAFDVVSATGACPAEGASPSSGVATIEADVSGAFYTKVFHPSPGFNI